MVFFLFYSNFAMNQVLRLFRTVLTPESCWHVLFITLKLFISKVFSVFHKKGSMTVFHYRTCVFLWTPAFRSLTKTEKSFKKKAMIFVLWDVWASVELSQNYSFLIGARIRQHSFNEISVILSLRNFYKTETFHWTFILCGIGNSDHLNFLWHHVTL